MKRITPAQVESTSDVLAGLVLLAESHASFHMDQASRRCWIDVFTCRWFDPVACCKEITALGVHIARAEVLDRGLEFIGKIRGHTDLSDAPVRLGG